MAWTALWSAFRRAAFLPICAAFMLFLIFFYLPESWLASTAWHLYLDRLHPLFTAPASLSGRAWMGGGAAIILFLLLTIIMLLLPRRRQVPRLSSYADSSKAWALSMVDEAVLDELIAQKNGHSSGTDAAPDTDMVSGDAVDSQVLPRSTSPASHVSDDAGDSASAPGDAPLPRYRRDRHPDDAPRPPISAQRDLPAGGLDGVRVEDIGRIDAVPPVQTQDMPPSTTPAAAYAASDRRRGGLESADLSQDDGGAVAQDGDPSPPPEQAQQARTEPSEPSQSEPWLRSADQGRPAEAASRDLTLSELVARLEARLARRRRPVAELVAAAAAIPIPVPASPPPMTVADHQVDLALEAALGTLQRMNLRVVG